MQCRLFNDITEKEQEKMRQLMIKNQNKKENICFKNDIINDKNDEQNEDNILNKNYRF